jgi:diguanylate cyclase (GGDEF)-like protein/PAS domain S-box-containing protein
MRTRLAYGGLLVGALLLIWGGAAGTLTVLRANDEAALEARIGADVLILEDHASRALDVVSARLDTLASRLGVGMRRIVRTDDTQPTQASAEEPSARRDDSIESSALSQLIRDDRVLRSLSVVDPQRRVIASSNPALVGLTLRANALPAADAPATPDGVRHGPLQAGRDLDALRASTADATPSSRAAPAAAQQPVQGITASSLEAGSSRFWLAVSTPPALADQRLDLVAVVNPRVFENLWAQVDQDETTEIALFDRRGHRLATHHPLVPDDRVLTPALWTAASASRSGGFHFGEDDRFRVAWRASPQHPVLLAVTGDHVRLQATRTGQTRWLLGTALAASLAAALLLGLLYRRQLRHEATLVALRNQARAIDAHVMVSQTTPDGRITHANDAYLSHCGYTLQEVVGQNHRIFNSGVHPRAFYERLWKTVLAGRVWSGVFRNRRRDGSRYWLSATIVPYLDAWGRVERFVAFYTDITESVTLNQAVKEERRQREDLARVNRSLLTAAQTDPLTGLANRRGFDSFVSQALEMQGPGSGTMAVMMLDLDHFKRVNDTHGHAAGDTVLREMAQRWRRQIRDSDLLARLGGEEFCIVLPATELHDAIQVAEKILSATRATPVPIASESGEPVALPITVSIGVAAVAGGMTTPPAAARIDFEALLQLADEAVYEAKHAGRDRVAGKALAAG